MLDWPSDARLLLTVGITEERPAFSKDGTSDIRYAAEPLLYLGVFLDFDVVEVLIRLTSDIRFLGDVGEAMDAAVPGLDTPLGGCGNEPMLIVFRTVCGVGRPVLPFGGLLSVGSSDGEDTTWGLCTAEDLEGAFSFEGVCERLFLVLPDCGMGGRAEVGGSAAGRERTGRDMFL